MAERIVVGMSGGVDSSVAAALLVEQGCDVVGITMRVWPRQEAAEEPTKRFGNCCGTEAVEDARQVARTLGIPHYLLSMDEEFNQKVIGQFVAAYGKGQTPIPCVSCNSDLKFGSLLGRARAWDAAAVATGHYARIERDRTTGRYLLLRASRPGPRGAWGGSPAGQRRGSGLAPGGPLYVIAPAPERTTVRGGGAAALARGRLVAPPVTSRARPPPGSPLRVAAKIRHSHQ